MCNDISLIKMDKVNKSFCAICEKADLNNKINAHICVKCYSDFYTEYEKHMINKILNNSNVINCVYHKSDKF